MERMRLDVPEPRLRAEISWLFQAALAIFVVTVAIGIANGTKLLGPLDRSVILTHVHAGTLGWITLGATSIVYWLFGSGGGAAAARPVAILAIVSVPCYVAAFASGNLILRAVFGALMLAAIAAIWAWTVARSRAVGWRALSTAQLAAALAMTTLLVGSALGSYAQLLYAAGTQSGLGQAIGGHAGAQTAGYLVLLAVGACEWLLRGEDRRGRAATAQVLLLFAAGMSIAIGVLFDLLPLLGIAALLQLLGTLIFIGRMVGPVRAAAWAGAGPGRHFAVAVPFLVANIALTIYLISLIATGTPFERIPAGLGTAFNHLVFVGVMTNVLFGLVRVFAGGQGWAWADHTLFWGMNAGLIAFIAALLTQQRSFEVVTAPVMGAAILLGILVASIRLRRAASRPDAVAAGPIAPRPAG